jgi:hypothetical protein
MEGSSFNKLEYIRNVAHEQSKEISKDSGTDYSKIMEMMRQMQRPKQDVLTTVSGEMNAYMG